MQQLCCLGLPAQVVVPLLLRELHQLVGAHWNGFLWCDRNGQLTNLYAELPEALALAPLYYQEFYNRRELEVFIGWEQVCRRVRRTTPFEALLRVPRRNFLRHAFYSEALRRIDFDTALYCVVRERDRPLGILAVHRTPGDRAFTAADARCLDRVSDFIRHALTVANPKPDLQWMDPDADGEGLILTDANGHLLWTSDNARRLLIMASCERLSKAVRRLDALRSLSGPLRRLVRCLEDHRHDRPSTAPPSWLHDNAWGRFRFHAQALDPTHGDRPLVGITVRHQRPLEVRLMQQIERLSLPPRQTQVCLLMACGQSYRRIARQLGIAESTVISHARAIYRGIDAHNRGELINRLQAL